MDRYETMRIFAAVADGAGFAAAARKLGLSPPAVTRAVAALESRIGTLLLHRTTRIVRPTEAGQRYLVDCKRILAEIDEAEASAAGAHLTPKGQLSVTASVMFGRLHVAPLILDFLKLYPAVSVRTLLLDRVVDVIEEGIDVAIRIAHPQDSSLMAVGVGAVRRVLCASPSYLKARGVPKVPADLADHATITFASALWAQEWIFGAGAKAERISAPSRFSVNASEVAIDAAIAGHGITQALSYQVAQPIADGRLKVVLADYEPPPIPVQVVHPEGRRASARVRAFVDFAVEQLRAEAALQN
jgi:DNA-binding transcriptional LysR family regulator